MLDLPGSLLKVLAPNEPHLLGQAAQVCMMCLHLCGARILITAAAESPAKVNELADRCGEILAEFIQCRVPTYGERVFFPPAIH